MGPRRWCRGKGRIGCKQAARIASASMGPRRWCRGKGLRYARAGRHRRPGFNGAATMVSRKRSQASRRATACRRELQWGRDDGVAEKSRSATRSRPRRCSFNGAATMVSRKSAGTGPGASIPTVRFNGAATMVSRKRAAIRARHGRRGPGFNGAATMVSRKRRRQRSVASRNVQLQWGRDDGVAEKARIGLDCSIGTSISFNGAATMVSRKRARHLVWCRITTYAAFRER